MSPKVHRYEGTALAVLYDPQRCIHAAECVRGLPEVFDSAQRPWIAPDGAAADRLAEVIRRCPSGALHYERKDGGEPEEPAAENVVTVVPDGPLEVRGRIEIASPDGTLFLRNSRATLCRCGASRNKPFCDRSHVEAGFHDPGVWPGNGVEATAGEGDVMHVVCCQDGPLVFQGAFELRDASGHSTPLRRRALCRCGGSAEKPFCDGSHARIGFKTEEPAEPG
jgi:CDGSH-type Zn-finger protein/uncharacterized Fe-S cluster protein YjdI